MTKLEKLRSRYLHDPIPVRLGGLAANLARVASFSKHDGHREAVSATLQESKWFSEWIAPEIEKEVTAELIRLQIQMAIWQIQSNGKWNDNLWRSELATQSEQRSQRILQMSGLQNT
jgi:hypothetical protein